MNLYYFKRLIEKYSNTFTVQKVSDGYYDDETGEYVPGTSQPLELRGMIAPMKANQIYNSGGRLTEADRVLYVFEPMEAKTKIQYKGMTYSVEAAEDFSDFADFHYYLLKAVSAFYAEA